MGIDKLTYIVRAWTDNISPDLLYCVYSRLDLPQNLSQLALLGLKHAAIKLHTRTPTPPAKPCR